MGAVVLVITINFTSMQETQVQLLYQVLRTIYTVIMVLIVNLVFVISGHACHGRNHADQEILVLNVFRGAVTARMIYIVSMLDVLMVVEGVIVSLMDIAEVVMGDAVEDVSFVRVLAAPASKILRKHA